jgi:hypothetical protein
LQARDWDIKDHCTLLTEERGLYTPPYHSELQPTVKVYAKIKGEVGSQYDTNTTFAMVYEKLLQAVDNASKDFSLVERIIDHANEEIGNFSYEYIPADFVSTREDMEHGADEEITSECA